MPTFESPESSSPIITRAVAAGLQNQYTETYRIPGWQKIGLLGLAALPQQIGRFVISHFQSISGLPSEVMDGFSIDDLIQQRLDDYSTVEGKFPAITIGAGLGGATAYIALAVGGPFLPQTFVTTLRYGSKTGDVHEYLNRSLDIALRIADDNPGLFTVQHFDPVHDGWLTRFVNHLRFKIIDLPAGYVEYIKSRLEPGGTIFYLDGGASWLRYRLGPRSVFQVGGWGDISAEEYLKGSDRIQKYAHTSGLIHTNWNLNDYPLELGPESEWGSEPGLDKSLENFCNQEGFRFIHVRLPHPNDFSRLAFGCAKYLLDEEGQSPSGVQIEMFSQFDATASRRAGLLPLWLIFNTNDSLEYLKQMSQQFPSGKPVFFSPLSTFSLAPDTVAWKEWEKALEGIDWINIGTRPNHYPSDLKVLVRWAAPLRKWVDNNPNPIKGRLTADDILFINHD